MATPTRTRAETLPDTPAGVLAALREEQDLRAASEVRSMRLAVHWVDLHPVLDPGDAGACFQSPKTLAGEGSPAIDEFTIPDLATILGQTCDAIGSWLTDVIELRHRLPHLGPESWPGTSPRGAPDGSRRPPSTSPPPPPRTSTSRPPGAPTASPPPS
ncbi:hypothetical protein [Nocardioides currus]|uniref:DUF222 domain-containing protein n=1 Tax=Nocardioides currus TaxID=2133958 RepID=A0A2R7Z0A9_9ACTN|nr:hypothetical protein [Nocardioides currus]PUA81994.1 hypothetical protein C7S10_08120 [Nocardioides currus]